MDHAEFSELTTGCRTTKVTSRQCKLNIALLTVGMGNPWNFTEDHMKEIFNSMDANGDGKVSFDELIKAYCVKK